jgi:hypothetical protein
MTTRKKYELLNKYFSLVSKLEEENIPVPQTWGQLHSNVIDYITITLQFS